LKKNFSQKPTPNKKEKESWWWKQKTGPFYRGYYGLVPEIGLDRIDFWYDIFNNWLGSFRTFGLGGLCQT
jgi:hypothetical protein